MPHVGSDESRRGRRDRCAVGLGRLTCVTSVGVAGFEPTAPRSQSECATKLRHTPGDSQCTGSGAARAHRHPPAADARPGILRGAPAGSACTLGRDRPSRGARGRSSMAELQSSKLIVRVRFPSAAPTLDRSEPPALRTPRPTSAVPEIGQATVSRLRRHHGTVSSEEGISLVGCSSGRSAGSVWVGSMKASGSSA